MHDSFVPPLPKPPFHARNEADREAMKDYLLTHPTFRRSTEMVMDIVEDILPTSGDAYTDAKRIARLRGDLQPLADFLSSTLGDPEIADFLALPRQKRGGYSDPHEQAFRDAVVTAVRAVRQIWREDFGRVNRYRQFDNSAEAIVAETFDYTEQQVRSIMKKAR